MEWRTVRWRLQACAAICGGILLHITLGTIYTFGNMSPYFTSYIREYSQPHDLRYKVASLVFAVMIVGQGLCMWIGGFLEKKLGVRAASLIGGLTMSLGVLLSYFTIQHSFALVILTYGLLQGFGIGLAYSPPLVCAMRWMPKRKGLVNGLIVAGFGGGAFIFDQVQTAFINPDNFKANFSLPNIPDEKVLPSVHWSLTSVGTLNSALKRRNNDQTNVCHMRMLFQNRGCWYDGYVWYFTEKSLLERVPDSFLLCGGCYVVLQLIGCLLLTDPPKDYNTPSSQESDKKRLMHKKEDDNENSLATPPDSNIENSSDEDENYVKDHEEDQEYDEKSSGLDLHPKEVIKTRAFWTLWTTFLLNGQAVVFISTLYKVYGQNFIDDRFLALVGAFSALFNAAGRMVWGHLADVYSYKVAMTVLCCCLSALMLTFIATSKGGEAMFFIWICAIFFVFSGNFSLFPTAAARSFGKTYVGLNFGLVFTSQAITAPIGVLLSSTLQDVIGWFGMFVMVAAFPFIAAILTMTFNVKNQKNMAV